MKIPITCYQISHSYPTSVTAAELQWHLSNMNVIKISDQFCQTIISPNIWINEWNFSNPNSRLCKVALPSSSYFRPELLQVSLISIIQQLICLPLGTWPQCYIMAMWEPQSPINWELSGALGRDSRVTAVNGKRSYKLDWLLRYQHFPKFHRSFWMVNKACMEILIARETLLKTGLPRQLYMFLLVVQHC